METYWIQDHPWILAGMVVVVVLIFAGIAAINRKKDRR